MTARAQTHGTIERERRSKRALLLVGLLPVAAYLFFTAFMFLAVGRVYSTAAGSLSMRLPLGWSVEEWGDNALSAKETRSVSRYWDGRGLGMRIDVGVTPSDNDAIGFAPTMLLRSETMHGEMVASHDAARAVDLSEVSEVEDGILIVNGIEGDYLIYEMPEGDLTRIVMVWECIENGSRVMVRYSSEAGHLERGFLLKRLQTIELQKPDSDSRYRTSEGDR